MRQAGLTVVFLVVLAVTGSVFGTGARVVYEKINGLPGGMQHEVEVSVTEYGEVRIKDVSLKYVEKNMFGDTNLLAVEGRVRNMMNTVLARAVVTVDFLDKNEKLMAREAGSVLPRIISVKGPAEGHFTVTTKYDPEISFCRMDVTWSGKRVLR